MQKPIYTDKAPEPIGPYSQGVEFGNLIFTSGMIGLDAKGYIVSDEIDEQTKQSIENLKSILEAAGSSLDNVIKTTVFLKDMIYFNSMNEVYKTYFTKNLPSRSTIAVKGLPKDVKVEIEAIAYKN